MNILDFVTIENFYHLDEKLYKIYFTEKNKIDLEKYLRINEPKFYDFYLKTKGNLTLYPSNTCVETKNNYFCICNNLNNVRLIYHFGNVHYKVDINKLNHYIFNEDFNYKNKLIKSNDLIFDEETGLFYENWFVTFNQILLISNSILTTGKYGFNIISVESINRFWSEHMTMKFNPQIFRTVEEKTIALLKYK